MKHLLKFALSACLLVGVVILASCQRDDMWDQPKEKVLGESGFFRDGMSSRLPTSGTVARGKLKEDEHLHEGMVNANYADSFPFEITKQVLEKGRDRYNIFCSPCHGRTGSGTGMIVLRGYKQPAAFRDSRLLNAPPGYFYYVLTQGYSQKNALVPSQLQEMIQEDDLVHPPITKHLDDIERWSVVAYIKVLQISQTGTINDVPQEKMGELDGNRTQERKNGAH